MARFCGNCGTEVDDDAAFCPSCGQPLAAGADDVTAEIPPAPAWPAPMREERPAAEDEGAAATGEAAVERAAASDVDPRPVVEPPPVEPPPVEPPPVAAQPPPVDDRASAPPPPPPASPPPPPAAAAPGGPDRPQQTQVDVPITWPVTMSGWLIGGGAVVAALGFLTELFALRGAGTAMSVIFLLLMLGLAATVFFSSSVPAVPHLRLVTLGVGFAALGVALDRLGFNSAGIGTLLVLIGAGAACAGAVIAELGRDRPMAGPMGGGG
ncbi:MAG TPA: zinc ribbon domain-containing protein [Candidatus Limnocylindria bacterium]|nr:zinc ribbon domain-containing protein [Candidatus Limnocylindria bacterium]